MTLTPLLALAGCMGGLNLETQITELRIVAAKATPAAVEPGEPFELQLWVADPLDLGGQVLTWSCPDDESDCAPQTTDVPDLVEGLTPPVFQTRIAVPTPIWMLACADGDCGDLSAPDVARLRDPFGWLQTLPSGGVSAASRPPPVALDPTAEPPTNPVIVEAPEVELDRTALEIELPFTVDDADAAFGYATSGGFDAPTYEPNADGVFTLTWVPDAMTEPGEVFVVFTNPAGGVEVWQHVVP